MIRNWYELTTEELKRRHEKLLDLYMDLGSKHPKAAKVWQALEEIGDVLEIRELAEKDSFLKMVVETLI